ncbi:hypothetical protein L2E82_36932 [Cichorium intybus]|uniref:Uncharacterized protein n=1 Tax=Cichorium intybus TaxID=13427 RepID=A0ACB9AHQ9_CICIN|nr:hypothetical protein L2E82_36932 [Cichorium intybus]
MIICLENPNKPQYNGGIVANPELKDGLRGWVSLGNAKLQVRRSETGNEFIVAYQRNQSFDSVSQEFFIDKEKLYTFSAWVQISHEDDATVIATFKTATGFYDAGSTKAKSGCWSMLKGGLTVNESGSAQLYFQSKNPLIDIWIDSVSLQPFTQEEWKSHHYQSIEKVRKSKVKIHAVDGEGKPLANRTITIAQKFARFPFGCAINKNILTNQAYENWFTSRFKYTTFENEMKWYTNERIQNQEDYSAADALLQLTKSNGISVRGHNVFWDDPKFQPNWVPNLAPQQLAEAATKRINSIMRRYSGQVIAWDVVNENMHSNFFESKLGWTASSKFYKTARALDRTAVLFLNEYNTIEKPGQGSASPDAYLRKIEEIRAGGYSGPLAIGLEGHFSEVNIPYMRSAIDKLATSRLPIWITELDVQPGPNQAASLEQVLREAHAHPAVNGIVMWSAWSPKGCFRMCLTDNDFRNLPTGDVVDKIIREFFGAVATATTDGDGYYETSLIHGDYEVRFADFDRHRSQKAHMSWGIVAHATPYDYSFPTQCLENPNKPQYNGGIVANPELKDGLRGWVSFGNAKLQVRRSETGNEFIVAYQRNQSFDSVSQEFFMDKEKLYTFSAWVQISHEDDATVIATFKTATGFYDAGSTKAKSGCWSMLKGGLTVNESGSAQLYFQSKNPLIDIWIDSVSLQPFTQEEWKSHHYQSIEKVRKSKVKIHAVDGEGKPLANRTITIAQKFARFPFGCAINKNILTNQAYENWFTSRFKYTTFENEMKWYTNERIQNQEDYSAADALLQLTKSNGISVRGHNVFWDDPKFQPNWVPNLAPQQLAEAATKRINSIMRRYSGQVIAWDVVNENMHSNFFESKLGWTASSKFYKTARALDRTAVLFLNEYNTIEKPGQGSASPDAYLRKIEEIRAGGYSGPLAIGLEGHFSEVNIPYMRSAIDKLATSRLPIWITELDVQPGPNQAASLEQVLREAHAHPAVNGIVMWSAWSPKGCFRMCLTDNDFRNLPTGDVVDKIIREFFGAVATATTDGDGYYETSLIHGDYEVRFADFDRHRSQKAPMSWGFKVEPMGSSQDVLNIKISG